MSQLEAVVGERYFYPKGTTIDPNDSAWERARVMFAVLGMNYGAVANNEIIARLAKVIKDYSDADLAALSDALAKRDRERYHEGVLDGMDSVQPM